MVIVTIVHTKNVTRTWFSSAMTKERKEAEEQEVTEETGETGETEEREET